MWLLRRLIQPNPVTPDRVVQKYRSMYMFIWRETPRAGWTPEPGQLESSSAGTSQLESSSAGTGQLESSSAGTGHLEPPSAGTCFETPGQQCLPNCEMGRTTVDGCLLLGVSSNLEGNILSPEEIVIGLSKDKEAANDRTSNSTPVGKEGSHHFEKRMN